MIVKRFVAFYLVITLFLPTIITFGQSLIYPKIPTDHIIDLQYINENEVIFINEYGSIYKSFDRGKSWEKIASYSNSSLKDIYFINETTGFIRIDNQLLYTTDVGNSWEKQYLTLDGTTQLPISDQLILRASDNGDIFLLDNFFNDWRQVFVQPMFFDSLVKYTYLPYGHIIQFKKLISGRILALDNNDMAGYYNILNDSLSVILKSDDFGSSWDTLFLGQKEYYEKISFYNDSIGWAKSYYNIYRTEDGGVNWKNKNIRESSISDISSISESKIYGITSYGTFFKSINSGDTWSSLELKDYGENKISFLNENIGLMYGDNLVMTQDGGDSWQVVDSSYKSDIYDICFTSVDEGYALSADGVYKTLNGGSSWNKIFSLDSAPSQKMQIKMLNDKNGWLLNYYGLYRTIDGGNNWQETNLESFQQIYKGFTFWYRNLGILYCVGGLDYKEHPEIYHYITTNGGISWIRIDSQIDPLTGYPINFEKMQFTDPEHLWAQANNGLWLSNDTARTWHHLLNINFYRGSFDFYNSKVGIVSNDEYEFLITTDGGDTWHVNPKVSSIRAFDCKFIGSSLQGNRYIEVGLHGKSQIYYLNPDGTIDWGYAMSSATKNNYNKLFVLVKDDRPNVWAAGNGFSILYRKWEFINSGINNNEEFSLEYSLKQNYPNPFNPITTISYQVLKASEVELTIYNLLGQKVATLVSEKQQAGQHQVKWDATGFPSGIYYYMIKAGEFRQVKKMVLVR